MIHAKMLGLLAVAAAALMAFAGSASATTVTSSEGTTPTIVAASEGSTTLDGVLNVTCQKSTVHGKVESHGNGVTAKGNISTLTFTECGDDTVVVNKAGSLEVHEKSGGNNFTLTSSGAEITIIADTIFGDIHCIFTTSATDIGTGTNGTHATLHIDSAAIPRTGGSGGFLCGSSGEWTGSYKVSSPTNLVVEGQNWS